MKQIVRKCEHCFYAAPSTFPDKDGKKWYSCRYNPPMPYADEKQSTYKDWRIVPEDFWCGQYATHYNSPINMLNKDSEDFKNESYGIRWNDS